MKPMGIIAQVRQENGGLRGLTGSGDPGLYTLLGGTGVQGPSVEYTTMGGSGQVSATAKLAKAYKDVRLAQVASGVPVGSSGSGGSGGGGSGGGGTTTGPGVINASRPL